MTQTRRMAVELRSTQANYLASVAEREGATVSGVFRSIIEAHALTEAPTRKHPRKVRKRFSLQSAHIDLIAALALAWGLSKSDVARRLVDAAKEADPVALR